MKTYEILLPNGYTFKVKGTRIEINKETGQTFVYAEDNTVFAVIPANAAIVEIPEIPQ